MSCLQLQAQSIQIPTIHVVEFNLDTLKHEINDSVLYYNRLKELKGQLKQEKQEVKMGLDIVKSSLKNQRDQLSLTKTKIKLLKKQIKTYEKELKSQNSEIKQINKMHNQLAKSDDVSLSSKNTQIPLKNRHDIQAFPCFILWSQDNHKNTGQSSLPAFSILEQYKRDDQSPTQDNVNIYEIFSIFFQTWIYRKLFFY